MWRVRSEVATLPDWELSGEPNAKIRLDRNENPFDLPHGLKRELFSELFKIPLNRYPPAFPADIEAKIAGNLGLSPENILLANGSDELIGLTLKLFEGDHVVVSPPTFGMYPFFAAVEGLKVVSVPLDENFELGDIEAHADGARAVFICSPNNPTGNVQPRERIIEVLETGAPVVLDEAYVEFSRGSNADLVNDYDNLVVLRTFSKAFGLAGLRVGYAVASEDTMRQLRKLMPPFSVNSLSLRAVDYMLDHLDYVRKIIRYIVMERERLYGSLRPHAYPSEANFLLVKLDAYEFLLERGIAVKKLSGRLKGHVRITVGRKEENDALLEALEEFLERTG